MQAVFFDANGVLYFRAGQYDHLRRFLAQYSLAPRSSDDIWRYKDEARSQPAYAGAMRAQRYDEMLQRCGVPSRLLAEGRQALDADAGAISLFAGVPSTLRELQRRGFKLGVITDTSVTTARKLAWLRTAGLDLHWDAFANSCEIGVRKPDPRIYHAALQQAGVAAAEAVFVGHAAAELAGARAVGIRTVAFNPDQDAVTDSVVPSFADLLELPLLAVPS